MLDRIESLCEGGILIEFGCGEGSLPLLLPNGTFSEYLGIDISAVAIERARQNTTSLPNCIFECSDIALWPGRCGVDLIVAEECLYYLTGVKLRNLMNHCRSSLSEHGKMLVIAHDGAKHRRTLGICRDEMVVEVDEVIGRRTYLTLKAGKKNA